MPDSCPRTVLVCFDGLSFEYLTQFDLPNFDSLRSGGVECPLESTFPPWTGNVCPLLYFGTGPNTGDKFIVFSVGNRYPEKVDSSNENDHVTRIYRGTSIDIESGYEVPKEYPDSLGVI